jgi:hypothetical protein
MISQVPNIPDTPVDIAKPEKKPGKNVGNNPIVFCPIKDIKNIKLVIHKTVPTAEAARLSGAHEFTCTITLIIPKVTTSTRSRILFVKILNRKPAKNTIIKVTRAYIPTIVRLILGRSLRKLFKREIKVLNI